MSRNIVGLILDKTSEAIHTAWNNRKPAGISRQIGYAVTGHNRRVEYANGHTEMYGAPTGPISRAWKGATTRALTCSFAGIWTKKLTGIIMNVTCPAQVTEAKYYISSDYWGELRKEIAKRFPGNVYILTQCGAAGDLSPRDLPRGYKSGEPNMWDVPGAVEIGKRLIHTIDVAYPQAQESIQTEVPFRHVVREIEVPSRRYSEAEYLEAVKTANEILSREPKGHCLAQHGLAPLPERNARQRKNAGVWSVGQQKQRLWHPETLRDGHGYL